MAGMQYISLLWNFLCCLSCSLPVVNLLIYLGDDEFEHVCLFGLGMGIFESLQQGLLLLISFLTEHHLFEIGRDI